MTVLAQESVRPSGNLHDSLSRAKKVVDVLRILELKFQRELNRARAADLVKRVEAAVGTAGAQAARQRAGRVAEQRAGQAVVGIAKVRVVKDVEEFRSETKAQLFGEV